VAKAENPWATGVLRKEVSVNTALANAQGQVPEFTQAQEPPVENPWATGVLRQRVQVDEELIPTTFKHAGGEGAAGSASGAPSEPLSLDTLIGAPQGAPAMPAAGASEPVIAPTVAMVNPGAWPALPAQTAQPAPSARGSSKGVVIAAVVMVLVAALVAVLLVFGK
jgi:hypothetical protein